MYIIKEQPCLHLPGLRIALKFTVGVPSAVFGPPRDHLSREGLLDAKQLPESAVEAVPAFGDRLVEDFAFST